MSIRPVHYIIAALVVLLAMSITIGVSMVRSRDRIIASKDQSIAHGAEIARARLEMDSTEAARIERERQRSKVLEAEYERLKTINTNLPIPKAPKTSKAMHEAILRAAKTE